MLRLGELKVEAQTLKDDIKAYADITVSDADVGLSLPPGRTRQMLKKQAAQTSAAHVILT